MHPTQAILFPLLQAPTANNAQAVQSWALVLLQGQSVVSYQESPQLAPAPQLRMPCTLVIAANALSWHRIQLPAQTLSPQQPWLKNPQPRLRNVLEGALEDQLLDEPAQLHFALQPDARNDSPVWVAACQRTWLQQVLAQVEQAGYSVQAICPELAPAPDTTRADTVDAAQAVFLCQHPEQHYWLWSDAQGVHQRPWQEHDTQPWTNDEPSRTVHLYAPSNALDLLPESLRHAVTLLSQSQRLQNSCKTDWNLAQFDLALHTNWRKRALQALRSLVQQPQWRPVRWTLLALLVLQIICLQVYAWRSQSILKQQRQAMQRVLTDTFPQTVVVVDAPAQMKKAVQMLQQSSGQASEADFEMLLGAWGQTLQSSNATPPSAPQSMRYSNGRLDISYASPWPADTQTALRAKMNNKGISTSFDGNTVQLRPATSNNRAATP